MEPLILGNEMDIHVIEMINADTIPNEEIKIVIIEDEEAWQHTLKLALGTLGYEVTGTAQSLEDAMLLLTNAEYDLILLDINLGGRDSGIELGRIVNTIYKKPFIYITATTAPGAILHATETHPAAYLTKPINVTSLMIAIQNAILHFSSNAKTPPAATIPEQNNTFFFVKSGDKYKKLEWKDIVYLQSDKNYTYLLNATDNTRYSIRSTLSKTLKNILPYYIQKDIVQINRAEAVHVNYIQEVTRDEVRTKFGVFTITDGYIDGLKSSLRMLS